MHGELQRIIDDLGARVSGPMRFRLVLQPLMALIFAIRAGVHAGREGAPPYLWALVGAKGTRRALLREGWRDVRTVFVMAAAIDVVYQVLVTGRIYLGESLFVAAVLAFVPYVVFRGLVTRATPQRRAA